MRERPNSSTAKKPLKENNANLHLIGADRQSRVFVVALASAAFRRSLTCATATRPQICDRPEPKTPHRWDSPAMSDASHNIWGDARAFQNLPDMGKKRRKIFVFVPFRAIWSNH